MQKEQKQTRKLNKNEKLHPKRRRALRIALRFGVSCYMIGALWCIVVLGELPGVRELRNIWIETAMTTADHQWLATWFVPKYKIEEVMSRQEHTYIVSDPSNGSDKNTDPNDGSGSTGQSNGEHLNTIMPDGPGGDPSKFELRDDHGNLVLVNDTEEDIIIVEIKGENFLGRILIVQDPSRVVVKHTSSPGKIGELLSSYVKNAGGVAAINGNGFEDTDGRGNGGTIMGWSMSGGKLWGNRIDTSASAGFTEDNILVVGAIKDPAKYKIRDMIQWGPSLIADGKKLVSGSAGWGLQPRTAIGQRADGSVLLAVVDGRQPLVSLGITVGDLSDILYDYGCINASLCDGGSSSAMWYGGALVGVPSTPMKTTGRYLPNAIVVLSKSNKSSI